MHSIEKLMAQIARGKEGSKPLTRDEARWLFGRMLEDEVDQVQLGGFLVAQRMKEETEEELAGFTDAVRDHIDGYGAVKAPEGAVDMPCYAGKRRSVPLHVAAALSAAKRGVPVVLHGLSGIDGRMSAWEPAGLAGVRRAGSLGEARSVLEKDNIVWLDIADFSPGLHRILQLRYRLGVRTSANTVARLLNPMACDGQLNGVSHMPFLERMARINVKTGQKRSTLFMSMEGEPEMHMNALNAIVRQEGKKLFRVRYGEVKNAPRPNPQMGIGDLMPRFEAVMAGNALEEERYALDRMAETIDWVSVGTLPASWNSTPLA